MTAPDFNAWLFLFHEADVEPLEWCPWFRNDQAGNHGSLATIQLAHLKAGRYALIATNEYEGPGPRPQPGEFTLTFGPD